MSAEASNMSGWLLMGLPGFAYTSGLQAIWIAIGLSLGTYISFSVGGHYCSKSLGSGTASASTAGLYSHGTKRNLILY